MGTGASLEGLDRGLVVESVDITLRMLEQGPWTDEEKHTILSRKLASALRGGGQCVRTDVNLLKHAFAMKFANRRRDVPPLSRQNPQQSPKPPPGSSDGSPRSAPSSARSRRGQSFAVSPRSPRTLRGDASPRLNILKNLAQEGKQQAEEDMPEVEEIEEKTEGREKVLTPVVAGYEGTSHETELPALRHPNGERGARTIIVDTPIPIDRFEGQDTWDSTRQQFVCGYCNQTWGEEKKFHFHLKYSSSHQKEVDKWKKRNLDEAEALVNCRNLVYSGSKFFWKAGATVDLDFYHHSAVKPECVEVLVHDSQREADLPRLYLDHAALLEAVTEEVTLEMKEKKREVQFRMLEALSSDNGTGGDGSNAVASTEEFKEEDVRQQIELNKISSLILTRLKLVKGDIGDVAGFGDHLTFEAFSSDTTPFVLEAAPSRLVPVRLSRHGQVNLADIQDKMEALKNHQKDLSSHTSQAERMSNLVGDAVGGFADAMRLRQEAKKNMSLARIKFQKAVRHIIAQIQVARTTAHLVKMGLWVDMGEN